MKTTRRGFFGLLFAAILGRKAVKAIKVTPPESGITIRHVKHWDALTQQEVYRMDVLYGYGAIRPQLSCRVLA